MKIYFIFFFSFFVRNQILLSSGIQLYAPYPYLASMSRDALTILISDNDSHVIGIISFNQQNSLSPTTIISNIHGLNSNSHHAMHIHRDNDIKDGCKGAGPHFNPFRRNHGSPGNINRHVGDLGNISTNSKGSSFRTISDNLVTLFGKNTVIGRTVVVHELPDDLGEGGNEESLKTGNAGRRIACGVIFSTS